MKQSFTCKIIRVVIVIVKYCNQRYYTNNIYRCFQLSFQITIVKKNTTVIITKRTVAAKLLDLYKPYKFMNTRMISNLVILCKLKFINNNPK